MWLTAGAFAEDLPRAQIPGSYSKAWLDQVGLFLEDGDREEYLALESDAARDLWQRDFWRARNPVPRLRLNSVKERFGNHLLGLRRFGFSPLETRGKMLLLHGPPMLATGTECGRERALPATSRSVLTASCIQAPSHQLFDFGPGAAIGKAAVLLVEDLDGRCKLYEPDKDPRFTFRNTNQMACRPGDEWGIPGRLQSAIKAPVRLADIEATGMKPRPLRERGSLPALPAAHRGPARFEVAAIERAKETRRPPRDKDEPSLLLVSADLVIPMDPTWWRTPLPWRVVSQRTDIYQNGRLLIQGDSSMTIAADPGPELRLPWGLRLLPGKYRLVLHVEDEQPHLFATAAFDLVVPETPVEAAATSRTTETRPQPPSATLPWIELAPLPGLQAGEKRVQLSAWNGEIDQVTYLLDGIAVTHADNPPFAAVVDLGALPLERTLEARAFNAAGAEIARDRSTLNRSLHRFSMDLDDRSDLDQDRVEVSGAVIVPQGKRLASVELFEGDERVRSFSTPKFRYRRTADSAEFEGGGAALVRAVATLQDGSQTEESLLLSRNALEEVEVQLVEVFAGVTTRGGKPLLDLVGSDFEVFEDGQPQKVLSFRRVEELPLHVALLLDTSSTMTEEMNSLRSATKGFLETVLRPEDRATILQFNHRAYVAAPFTNDAELLAAAAGALQSWGGTSLIASSLLAMHYLRGTPGKKALILVSDGVDQDSTVSYDDLTEYAARVDAAVYTIGLGLPTIGMEFRETARKLLGDLADRTGGRFFPIKSRTALPDVFAAIESDLRSQYLLTYESPAGDSTYRQIDVKVSRRGRVQAKPGYYPQ